MIKFIFELLESIGFTHPLHPAIVHLPMGLIMGGFAFVLAAIFFKQPVLFRTAHHSATLALIGIPPTVILGIMDWQYSFGGAWVTPIKVKMGLAVVMTILLVILHLIGKRAEESPSKVLIIYGLATLTAIGMGYTGGQLLYG